ncbi:MULTISPECIES: TetR/AcrR family transcriptional regulator [unclassified Streptomyces]|uniref:TetR/AcrR family transcriptional regulator n=1 Tax=unclassified Streptomyces TaxID=2593676 RepID=UPI001661BD4C|nr:MULTISPECIES: TetR family transcriptional regulator [unclassified Streptomyces]MBD0841475.1 TetR family transcriptional regulator [Streptomyces sp. TRM68416]
MADGARERGKARRREAILRAAYKLFAERGFEAATIADIAEEAEVSPRTVTLYFPSKMDLATSHLAEFTERLSRALNAREPGVTTLEALERFLRQDGASQPDATDVLYERMLDANPQLRAIANSRLAEVIQEGARLFAAERGSDPDAFGPRMVAAAAAAVVGEVYLRPSEENFEAAMAFLAAGISSLPGDRLA